MTIQLTENEQKVVAYIENIAPGWATNTDIELATQIHPHQQVFQITQRLMKAGMIIGEQGRSGREGEWTFSVLSWNIPVRNTQPAAQKPFVPPNQPEKVKTVKDNFTPADFERLAEQVMSRYFGKPLHKGSFPGVPKEFDLVSEDRSVAGDAKYFTLVKGSALPPAKFSVIAEHVWLLEKTQAKHKFLVFGNQREVPNQWLKRYGHLVQDVEFFYLSNDDKLEILQTTN
jgi:hypothetical protein